MTKPVNNIHADEKTETEFSETDIFRIVDITVENRRYNLKSAIDMVRYNKKLSAKNKAYQQQNN